jgi:hypothetical protein
VGGRLPAVIQSPSEIGLDCGILRGRLTEQLGPSGSDCK